MLFVDLGLAVRLAGEVLRRDLLLRRRLLVKLAAHLEQIVNCVIKGGASFNSIKQD